jgi:hypothetical protein
MHYPTMPSIETQPTDWVLNAYRENFYAYHKSQAQKRLSELSAQYGNYVYITRQRLGYYHAVFSHTPGSLLAEHLCLAFSNERFFIACRYLNTPAYHDSLHIIIVLNGQIYAERTIPISSPDMDEFDMISLWDYPFKLILIDIPVDTTVDTTGDRQDQHWQKIIETLVFLKPYLASASHYETKALLKDPSINTTLIPLEIAKAHCPSPRYIPLILGLLSSLILGSVLFSVFKPSHTITTTQPVEIISSNPYSAYQQAISMHLPVNNLFHTIQDWLTTLISVNGWQLREISYHDSVVRAQLERDPSTSNSSSTLSDLSERLGATLQIDGNSVSLTRSLTPLGTTAQLPLSPLLETQVAYIDELNHYLHQANVQFSHSQPSNDCQHIPMQLRLNEGTIIEWRLLAKLLMRYPITIDRIQVMRQGNTLPVELNAELWGSH